MIHSTLLTLLKKFDKQQLKDFNNFVRSPFFNTNNALVKLYEYIRKQYPEYQPEKLEKEYVFKKLFGKTKYNDGFLRVLMSNLQDLAEEYLVVKAVSRDTMMKAKFLLDELSVLGERKLSEKALNRELKLIKDISPDGPDTYLGMYYLTFYKRYLYSTQFVVNKTNKPDENIYEEQKYLNYHFMLRTLANHFYHLNQSRVIKYEPRLEFLDEIIVFLKNNPEYLESPILAITFMRVLLLKNNDAEDYYRLKDKFYGIHSKLHQKDSYNTISIMINFCHKNYSDTDNVLFLKEKFEILKFGIEHRLHFFEENDGFDSGRFNNIVNTAVDLGQMEWAEEFISKYSHELEEGAGEFFLPLAIASVDFARGNFEQSLNKLAKLKNPSSTTDKFNLKSLQLRIYYELGYDEQAEAGADSFRHFIQNDKLLPEQYKEGYRNFHVLYNKLLHARNKRDVSIAAELTGTLKNLKPVVSKKWLAEKIDELLK